MIKVVEERRDEDLGMCIPLPDSLGCVQSVRHRHLNIHDHEIRLDLLPDAKRFTPIPGFPNNLVTCLLEGTSIPLANHRVIVDKDNSQRHNQPSGRYAIHCEFFLFRSDIVKISYIASLPH